MGTEDLIKELNLIYTMGNACSWWDLKMTEALKQAIEAVKDNDLCRANVKILAGILEGKMLK